LNRNAEAGLFGSFHSNPGSLDLPSGRALFSMSPAL